MILSKIPTRHWRSLPVLAVLVATLGFAGCGDDSAPAERTAPATFSVRSGVENIFVTGAEPQSTLVLYSPSGQKMVGLISDQFGQAAFSYVPETYQVYVTGNSTQVDTNKGATIKRGDGYTIRDESTDPVQVSQPFSVLGRDDVAPESFYNAQQVNDGFQYITMRDGVKLSINVKFPAGDPPWPTVVEYSGYSPSNPDSLEPGSSIISQLGGYAVVGVNMRGTGCSGGVFDVFNPAQQADGYDMIEIIAHQPWVLHNKVGMVGLSYSGISQLYVASTRPPHLAAITPLSVIEDPWRQQWPGGVYNAGFTKQWLAERDRESSAGGSSWVQKRIDHGDVTCAEHQVLRNQNIDFEHFGRALEFYPTDEDDRRLGLLVRNINVPVYLTGAWQDEQTGSLFAHMLDDFVNAPTKKFIMFNGRHPDGYSPAVITRWWEFLEFYVAQRIPKLDPTVRQLAPLAFEQFFDVRLPLEPDRFPDATDYETTRAAYEAEPQVRLLFEVGGGYRVPGAPVKRYETSLASWPPPNAQPLRFYLDNDGRLSSTLPTNTGTDHYQHDPLAGPITYTSESASDFLKPLINFSWPPLPDGYGLSYLTDPLPENVVVAGNGGYVSLWFASQASDANIEATITEVQADGTEVIVQSGVFRAGHRKVDAARSGELWLDYTFKESDYRALTPGEMIEVKVPLRPWAHAFRAGSRIRLIIDTPGRDSPLWAYENPNYSGPIEHSVTHGPAQPSALLLSVIDGVDVPPGYPPCQSLRGQICRPYVALENH